MQSGFLRRQQPVFSDGRWNSRNPVKRRSAITGNEEEIAKREIVSYNKNCMQPNMRTRTGGTVPFRVFA